MDAITQIDNQTKKKILFLFVFSLIEFVCYITETDQIGGVISVILLYLSVFWDKQLPLCVYIIKSILGVSTEGIVNTLTALYLSLIALYVIYSNLKNPVIRKYTILTLYFFVVLLISYITGINSYVDYAIKIIVASLIILQIASCTAQERYLIVSSVLCSGISMALIVLTSIYLGTLYFDTATSLQFDEHSKTLSTALAPVVFSAVYILLFGRRTKRILLVLGLSLAIAVLSYMLVLTYSRAVLIALGISIIYLIMRYMGKMNYGKFIFLAFFAVAVFYLITNIQFDNEMMFENVEGGNGRTIIWADFIQQLKDTNSLAFGFGPGFTKDISRLGFYSHSTILDYLFCYGIAGFLYILFFLYLAAINLFKINKNSYYYQGLFLLGVIMFSTHGSAGTLLFNVILGLSLSSIVLDNSDIKLKGYYSK